jgi:hypothetical protein
MKEIVSNYHFFYQLSFDMARCSWDMKLLSCIHYQKLQILNIH